MNKDTYLSIIMATHNCHDNIGRTINSILNQSYGNFELIISDDGSDEETLSLIREYAQQDERIVVLENSTVGQAGALNEGLRNARGTFVTFAIAGDKFPKDSLKLMHQIAVTRDCDIICGLAEIAESTGSYRNKSLRKLFETEETISPNSLQLVHDYAATDKWIRRSLIEEKSIRFGDYAQMTMSVFVCAMIVFSDYIYTCPAIIYTSYQRLLNEDGTVYCEGLPNIVEGKELDTGSLRGCLNAFGTLCRLTTKFGNTYAEELAAWFLQKILIDMYYRHMWMLDEECEDLLVRYANRLLDVLNPTKHNQVLKKNFDLLCQDGFKGRERMLDMTFALIAVSRDVTSEHIPKLLYNLYWQSMVSFRVILDEKYREDVPEEYLAMENLEFRDGDVFNQTLGEASGPLVAFIDCDMVYEKNTLRRMASSLFEKPVDFVSMLTKQPQGSTASASLLVKTAYEKSINTANWMLANKLFMNVVLRDNHVEFLGKGAEDAAFLFRALDHRMLKSPGMISLVSDEYILNGMDSIPHVLKNIQKNKGKIVESVETPSGASKFKNFFRSFISGEPQEKADPAPEPVKEEAPEETKESSTVGIPQQPTVAQDSDTTVYSKSDLDITQEEKKVTDDTIRMKTNVIASKLAEDSVKKYKKRSTTEQLDFEDHCYFDLDIDKDLVVLKNHALYPEGDLLYLLRAMYDSDDARADFRKICLIVNEETMLPTKLLLEREDMYGIELVEVTSDRYTEVLYSAGMIFADDLMPKWWVKKPGQRLVSMFIRTTFLNMGASAKNADAEKNEAVRQDLIAADAVVVPNKFMQLRLQQDYDLPFSLSEKALLCGRPGTGILLDHEIRRDIRERLDLEEDETFIFWLPDASHREDFRGYVREVLPTILACLKEGQTLCIAPGLIRADVIRNINKNLHGSHLIAMPEDMDIYEIMSATDILISDFSTLLIDFAVTRRKILLMCDDRWEIDHHTGFYVDIRTLPFPFISDTQTLTEELTTRKDYDDRDFLRVFNTFDQRHSVQQIVELLTKE